jgi:hypothetical protein
VSTIRIRFGSSGDAIGLLSVCWPYAFSTASVPPLRWRLSGLLHGAFRVSDYHNSLKLGYDPAEEAYGDWLFDQVGRKSG